MRQLLPAAVELQRQSIFHRDLKLENLLVETGAEVPRVCLIDFGEDGRSSLFLTLDFKYTW